MLLLCGMLWNDELIYIFDSSPICRSQVEVSMAFYGGVVEDYMVYYHYSKVQGREGKDII